jgi:hypothetical protein
MYNSHDLNTCVTVLCTGLPVLFMCLSFSQGMNVSLMWGTTMTSENIPQSTDLRSQMIRRYEGVAEAHLFYLLKD